MFPRVWVGTGSALRRRACGSRLGVTLRNSLSDVVQRGDELIGLAGELFEALVHLRESSDDLFVLLGCRLCFLEIGVIQLGGGVRLALVSESHVAVGSDRLNARLHYDGEAEQKSENSGDANVLAHEISLN